METHEYIYVQDSEFEIKKFSKEKNVFSQTCNKRFLLYQKPLFDSLI